jgi:hypothetical protein
MIVRLMIRAVIAVIVVIRLEQRRRKAQKPDSAPIKLQEAYSKPVLDGQDTLSSEIDDSRMCYQLAPS